MEASIIFLTEIILTFVKIKIKERNGEDVAYSLNRILDKAQMNIKTIFIVNKVDILPQGSIFLQTDRKKPDPSLVP